jgi:hypothetical protein
MKSNYIGRTDSCAVCYMKGRGTHRALLPSPGSDEGGPLRLLGAWVRLKRNRGSRRACRVGPYISYMHGAQFALDNKSPHFDPRQVRAGVVRPSRECRLRATEGPFGAARLSDDRLKRQFLGHEPRRAIPVPLSAFPLFADFSCEKGCGDTYGKEIGVRGDTLIPRTKYLHARTPVPGVSCLESGHG